MSHSSLRKTIGRQPFQVVELYLDQCGRSGFGVDGCTATGEPCYFGRASCKDVPNYINSAGTKIVRLCSQTGRIPDGLEGAMPCLLSVSPTAPVIDPTGGMGVRASVRVDAADFPHSDIGMDRYVGLRAYNPLEQGTFFGKLRARNPFYAGRRMRVLTGYLTEDGAYVPANFEARNYFIENVSGPNGSGKVSIVAKDVLKFAGDDRAQAPFASSGKLVADIAKGATSLTLTPAGVGNLDYSSSGHVRIGSEIFSFTRSGDVMNVVPGQYGTAYDDHKADDTVQECWVVTSQRPQDILYTLLTKYAKIKPIYLDKVQWDAEQVAFLPRLYSAIITTPTGVSKLIAEITEEMGFYVWWHEVQQKVLIRAVRPAQNSEITTLGENYQILTNSVSTKDLTDQRFNEVWLSFGCIDPTQKLNEPTNYRITYVKPSIASQDPSQDGDVRIKKIFSRWITNANAVAAYDLADKILTRSVITPVETTMLVDYKDSSIELADFVMVESRQSQQMDGAPALVTLQVLQRNEKIPGSQLSLVTRQAHIESVVPNNTRQIVIADDMFGVNLRTLHDSIYTAPVGGEEVVCTIKAGVKVGGLGKNYLHDVINNWRNMEHAPRGNVAIIQLWNPLLQDSTQLRYLTSFGGGLIPAGLSDQQIVSDYPEVIARMAAISFRTGLWPQGCKLKLVIEAGAYIIGEGGNGNGKANGYFGTIYGPSSGGVALAAEYPITVQSFGTVAGGGPSGVPATDPGMMGVPLLVIPAGGGAGYGASTDNFDRPELVGGRGGRVGINSWANILPQYQSLLLNVQATDGDVFVPGTGAKQTWTSNMVGSSTDGAYLGQNNPYHGVGLAGNAVVNNYNITWMATGTIIGAVS